ncbi:MAG: hypothetical protein WD066_17650 [Planctomycetaceae bacterium]
MKPVFADTLYWIGVAIPTDQWHEPSTSAKNALGEVILVTTDEVLTEFLNSLSKTPELRRIATRIVQGIMGNPNVKVVPQTRGGFLQALDRFAQRPDKQYSLVDCGSMNVIQAEGIQEVLTNDHHFEQEGFTILIRKE